MAIFLWSLLAYKETPVRHHAILSESNSFFPFALKLPMVRFYPRDSVKISIAQIINNFHVVKSNFPFRISNLFSPAFYPITFFSSIKLFAWLPGHDCLLVIFPLHWLLLLPPHFWVLVFSLTLNVEVSKFSLWTSLSILTALIILSSIMVPNAILVVSYDCCST